MSQSLAPDEEQAADAAPLPTPARRLTGRSWLVIGLVALVGLGLALGYLLWWTRPTAFTEIGNAVGMGQTTDTMQPVTFDMVQRSVHSEPETITLSRVRPRVVTNTAEALISFVVCTPRPPFIVVHGPASRSCETVTDVEGQGVRLTGDASTTIAMTVAPAHAGRVVIEGMAVDYARGSDHLWQRGSQATGPVVRVRVSE